MSKINVSQWKEFKLTELFTVSSGTKFDRRRVILTPEPHNINFIGRTGSLNGINAKCGTYKNTEPFSAGLLTVALGGTIGACFVQNKPFYTSQNVDVLIPLKCYVSKMTWNVKQFIASCIFYESQNNYLTFVRELNKHIKRDFAIKLPVTSSGQPDWQYMDEYIAKLATQAHTNISLLRQQQKKAPTVNIDRWKEFKISDIYPIIQHPRTRSKKDYEQGSMPFIASGSTNNGIDCYLEPKDKNDYEKADCLTVSPVDGSCFYQSKPFLARGGGGSSILILRSKSKLNEAVHIFLATIITRKLKENYSFNTMGNSKSIANVKIKLPVTESDEPDWQYMDNYISAIQQAQKERVARLTSIIK